MHLLLLLLAVIGAFTVLRLLFGLLTVAVLSRTLTCRTLDCIEED